MCSLGPGLSGLEQVWSWRTHDGSSRTKRNEVFLFFLTFYFDFDLLENLDLAQL